MIRIKKNKKKKKIKGFRSSGLRRQANQKIVRSLTNQYVSRKLKKRVFRSRWIRFINSQLRILNLRYSLFISRLKKQNIFLNRKILYMIILKDLMGS